MRSTATSKVVTDRGGEILGVAIVGARAGETITAWTLAISQKRNIRDFAGLVVPYPTYAEWVNVPQSVISLMV